MIRVTILANLVVVGALWGQSASTVLPDTPSVPPTSQPAAAPSRPPLRYVARRAEMYYALVWGVDSLVVKAAESGEMIRFSYHVLDGEKAQALNDKKVEPALISPEKGIKLVVPSLEQVGLLRQTPKGLPEAGKSYWMAFSNPGRPIRRGDRVNVVIGRFHADGLIVE